MLIVIYFAVFKSLLYRQTKTFAERKIIGYKKDTWKDLLRETAKAT